MEQYSRDSLRMPMANVVRAAGTRSARRNMMQCTVVCTTVYCTAVCTKALLVLKLHSISDFSRLGDWVCLCVTVLVYFQYNLKDNKSQKRLRPRFPWNVSSEAAPPRRRASAHQEIRASVSAWRRPGHKLVDKVAALWRCALIEYTPESGLTSSSCSS